MMDEVLNRLDQAHHIVAGIGIPLSEAIEIVNAAHDEYAAKLDQPPPPTTIGNVTYVDFRRR